MLKKILIALLIIAGLILIGLWLRPNVDNEASSPQSEAPKEATGTPVMVGVFSGTLPCADCEGIATELMLVQNAHTSEGSYTLVETYLGVVGENNIFPSSGTWVLEQGTPQTPGAAVYVLDPEQPEATRRFMVVNDTTLRLLDQSGNEIESDLPYELRKQ